MKILLMGNPNVGKSAVFNRLTGAKVTESNYPGTTVDYTKGYMRLEGKDVEIIDVPGTFSLEPKDKAEEVAVKMLKENRDSIIICVIDSVKLERGLYLALEIIEEGYPVVIALNMWDVAEDKN
ncbi:MAG TPA: GTP-binding protein, partial [Deltaproteobacteria bacterium]|nr:GTP-binding protein [Deltaproteobacteria bacterium]